MVDHTRQVRRRVADDVSCCATVLVDVHRDNGYPARWPTDPQAFLSPPGRLDAWVALLAGAVVGHALLCRAQDQTGPRRWTDLVDAPRERIGLIRQLFVSPHQQGADSGRCCLRPRPPRRGSAVSSPPSTCSTVIGRPSRFMRLAAGSASPAPTSTSPTARQSRSTTTPGGSTACQRWRGRTGTAAGRLAADAPRWPPPRRWRRRSCCYCPSAPHS